MANAYVEFVKEYRKKNPKLSYKEAMVEAKKHYKKKDTGKKTKGGSLEGSDVSGVVGLGAGLDKKTRTKMIKQYRKLLSSLEADLKDKRFDNDKLKMFRDVATKLADGKTTNQYYKALKRVERTINSKKFQKGMSLEERQKMLKEVKEKQKTKPQRTITSKQYEKEQESLNRLRKSIASKIERLKEQLAKGKITQETYNTRFGKLKDEAEAEEKKRLELEKLAEDTALENLKITSAPSAPSAPLTYAQFVKQYSTAKGIPYRQAQKQIKSQGLYKPKLKVSVAPTPAPKVAPKPTPAVKLSVEEPKADIDDLNAYIQKYGRRTPRQLFSVLTDDGKKKLLLTNVAEIIREGKALQKDFTNQDLNSIIDDLENVIEFKDVYEREIKRETQTEAQQFLGQVGQSSAIAEAEQQKTESQFPTSKDFAENVYPQLSRNGKRMDKILVQYIDQRRDDGADTATIGNELVDIMDRFDRDGGFKDGQGTLYPVSEPERDVIRQEITDTFGGTTGAGFYGETHLAPKEIISKDELEGAGLFQTIVRRFNDLRKKFGKQSKHVKEQSRVDKEDNIYVRVSDEAYKKPSQRSTRLGAYNLVPQLSNDEHVVYVDENMKTLIVGFRGSVNFKDFKTDLKLAMGGIENTDRFRGEKAFVEGLLQNYAGYKVIYTGHSLGGTLSIEMTRLNPDSKAVVFNAGHTPFRKGRTKDLDIKYYSQVGDAVSNLGANSYKDVRLLDDGKDRNVLQAHTLDRFKPEDETEEGAGLIGGEGGIYQGGGFHRGMKKKKPSLVGRMKHHLRALNKQDLSEEERQKHIEKLKEDVEHMKDGEHKDKMRKMISEL